MPPTPDYPISTDSSRYQTVAASTTQACGPSGGAAGDRLAGLTIIPATSSPGAVQIKDGSGSPITIFAGGANSVGNLAPLPVFINAYSAFGAWSVITGANVSVLAVGLFT
jgi:hypothetical protein